MSRILFVVPPLVGHVNPTVPLGLALTARGHEVAWAGLPTIVDRLLPEGARFFPVVGALDATEAHRLGEAAKAMEPFDEAYAKTDWSRFEHLPLFRVANRMNAYTTYLLMEQQGEP